MLVAKGCLQYMTEAWPLDIIQAWHEDKELLGQVHSVHLALSGSISEISERPQAMLIPRSLSRCVCSQRPGNQADESFPLASRPSLEGSYGHKTETDPKAKYRVLLALYCYNDCFPLKGIVALLSTHASQPHGCI
jgi:hypothetical protein